MRLGLPTRRVRMSTTRVSLRGVPTSVMFSASAGVLAAHAMHSAMLAWMSRFMADVSWGLGCGGQSIQRRSSVGMAALSAFGEALSGAPGGAAGGPEWGEVGVGYDGNGVGKVAGGAQVVRDVDESHAALPAQLPEQIHDRHA